MNEMRKLMESVEKIEEGYFSEIDIENQEEAMRWIKRNRTGEMTPDLITTLGRESFQAGNSGELSKEAAEHVLKLIRREHEEAEPQFPKEFGSQVRWAADYAKKYGGTAVRRGVADYVVNAGNALEEDRMDPDDDSDDWLSNEEYQMIKDVMAQRGHEPHSLGVDKQGRLAAKDDLADGSPEYIISDDGEVLDLKYDSWYNPNEQEMDADVKDRMFSNPFEGIEETLEEEPEIKYLKYPEGYEPPKMPERHVLDSIDWMYVPDNVIQMMKSLEHKMVSQKVWDKGVELAGGEDKLWKVIQWRAEEIEDRYHGSGDGIGSSDMNHFVRGVFSDIGEDDIWGWDKKLASDEDMERDKANRGAKFGKAIRAEGVDESDEGALNDRYDDETLECKHCGSYFCTSKFGGECPEIQRDLFDEGEEDKNLGPYEDNTEKWQGQTVKITGGEYQGETGKVVDAKWERNEEGSREGVYQVKLYSGPVVTLYLSEWSHDQIELAYDPTNRPDGKYDPELEEAKPAHWLADKDRPSVPKPDLSDIEYETCSDCGVNGGHKDSCPELGAMYKEGLGEGESEIDEVVSEWMKRLDRL